MAAEIYRRVRQHPPGAARLRAVKREIEALDDEVKPLVDLAYWEIKDNLMAADKRSDRMEKRAAFALGVGLVIALVAINIYISTPTNTQQQAFRAAFMLGGGGFGLLLPGAVLVERKGSIWKWRATGAVAFAIIFRLLY